MQEALVAVMLPDAWVDTDFGSWAHKQNATNNRMAARQEEPIRREERKRFMGA